MAKCQFRKKNGNRCTANAQPANGLCVFHDPSKAADGHRARRAGGLRRTRSAVLAPDTPDHPLGSTTEIARLLGDSINQIRRGELDPRVANAMGYLAGVLLRALEQGPVEERIANIEAALGLIPGISHIPAVTSRPQSESKNEGSKAKC